MGVAPCHCRKAKQDPTRAKPDEPPPQSDFGFGLTREQRFWKFHGANPHVYDWIVQRSLELLAAGHTTYSMTALLAELRYSRAAINKGEDRFRVNDHHARFYKELIMKSEPCLRGFFKVRNPGTRRCA